MRNNNLFIAASQTHEESLPFLSKFIYFVSIATIFLLLACSLNNSLWIDEILSAWLSSLTYEEIYKASLQHPQSPLFLFYQHTLMALDEKKEWILRCGSLAALAGSCVFMFRINLQVGNQRAAYLSLAMLLGTEAALRPSVYARPYSLALFACIVSIYYFIQWLENSSTRDFCVHCLSLTLTISLHYLFLPFFFICSGYVFIADKTSLQKRIYFVGAGFSALAFLLLSLNIFYIASKGKSLSSAAPPSLDVLGALIAPMVLLTCVFMSIFSLAKARKVKVQKDLPHRIYFLSLLVLPIIIAFVLDCFAIVSIFIPRYLLITIPGVIVISSYYLARTSTSISIPLSAIAALVSAILLYNKPLHPEDWKTAARYLRQAAVPAPVLLYSGIVENREPIDFNNSHQLSYLLTPNWFYEYSVKSCPLTQPLRANSPWLSIEKCLAKDSEKNNKFYLIARNEALDATTSCDAFNDAILKSAYLISDTKEFGAVCLIEAIKKPVS